jgi:hypothetical protein
MTGRIRRRRIEEEMRDMMEEGSSRDGMRSPQKAMIATSVIDCDRQLGVERLVGEERKERKIDNESSRHTSTVLMICSGFQALAGVNIVSPIAPLSS